MGWGDYIITAGLVRKLKTHNPDQPVVLERNQNYEKDNNKVLAKLMEKLHIVSEHQ